MEITVEDILGYILANGKNGHLEIDVIGEEAYQQSRTQYQPEIRNEEGEVIQEEKMKEPIMGVRKFRYTSIHVNKEMIVE